MKIKNVAIKNFRGYSDEINSDFEDLTAFVGKNDIGKSTILEALDIFFNDGKGVTKLDKADLNVESKARQETDISIRVCFTDLPEKIVIDTTNETSLSAEYLLNSDGLLEVVKRYPNVLNPSFMPPPPILTEPPPTLDNCVMYFAPPFRLAMGVPVDAVAFPNPRLIFSLVSAYMASSSLVRL